MYRIGLKMKKAFTMIELIFVIVVIGILAAVIMPRTGSNKLHEAATQVLSHIRYTQHLAMVDDKFDENNATWWKQRWQVRFRTSGGVIQYAVFNDLNDLGNINCNASECTEPALDPLTKLPLFYTASRPNKNMELSNFGITNLTTTCNTDDNFAYATRLGVIAFDNFGRPYSGIHDSTSPTQYLMTANCDIVLTGAEGNVTIRVHPETGYACILNGNVCQ
jgi:prepilin-type N-terminal cleavage/methylation domain-containing protein